MGCGKGFMEKSGNEKDEITLGGDSRFLELVQSYEKMIELLGKRKDLGQVGLTSEDQKELKRLYSTIGKQADKESARYAGSFSPGQHQQLQELEARVHALDEKGE